MELPEYQTEFGTILGSLQHSHNQECAEQVIKLRKIYWLLGLRFIIQSLPEYIEHGVLVQTKVQIRQLLIPTPEFVKSSPSEVIYKLTTEV
jgi:hypothetical protein